MRATHLAVALFAGAVTALSAHAAGAEGIVASIVKAPVNGGNAVTMVVDAVAD